MMSSIWSAGVFPLIRLLRSSAGHDADDQTRALARGSSRIAVVVPKQPPVRAGERVRLRRSPAALRVGQHSRPGTALQRGEGPEGGGQPGRTGEQRPIPDEDVVKQ